VHIQVILLPVTVGILLFNVVLAPAGIIMAIIVFALNIWLIVENRKIYANDSRRNIGSLI